MGNLKTGHKKAILIGAGLLLLVMTFFLIFQRNSDTIMEVESETSKAKSQVEFLSNLQMQVNEMRDVMPDVQKETEAYLAKFPSTVTQEKAIANVAKMMVDSGIRVTSIRPGNDVTFFQGTTVMDEESMEMQAQSEEVASASAIEFTPEQKVPLNQMVGKYTPYEIDLSGSKRKIMKAIDWVAKNEEHMNVSSVSLAFDKETGKLAGKMTINYFAMNGNGVPYEEPDISGITFGTKNIFGTFEKN